MSNALEHGRPDGLPASNSASDEFNMTDDARRYAPAAARNRGPILEVLRRHLPARGVVLEIASGSGEHIVHFAEALGPGLEFQPSDPEPAARESIAAWSAGLGLTNIRPPLDLDAAGAEWPLATADAVLCINMIHISPWSSAIGLIRGAARVLPDGGLLYLYGPFRRGGGHTAVSNEKFDADLRRQNPVWGIRNLEDVTALAAAAGFALPDVVEMPANNLSVIFRRSR